MKPAALEQVAKWLDEHCPALPAEDVDVPEATGRVLADASTATRDLPAAPTAAVDGYALSSAATLGASDYNPLPFRVLAGEPGESASSTAFPVVSGQTLPPDVDTVIPLEETDLRGDVLDVYAPLAAGSNVVPAGREARAGDTVLDSGRLLRPADVALLMELETSSVRVVRRPCIRILVTRGNDRDSSGTMVRSLVTRDGGACNEPDVPGRGALARIPAEPEDDLVIVIGGTGLGPNDTAAKALADSGEVVFRGVAISPGETTTLGLVRGVPAVMLPGPPLAALVAYDLVAGTAVRRLAGREPGPPYGTRRVVLSRKIASGLGRLQYCRVRLDGDQAEPIAVTDERTLATAARADGFVLVPEHSEGFPAGAEVTAYLYGQRY